MTKQDAIDAGKAQADQTFWVLFNAEKLPIDDSTTRDRLTEEARRNVYGMAAIPKHLRVAYEDAYVRHFVNIGLTVYDRLPAVKERRLVERLDRYAASNCSEQDDIAKFAEELKGDPAYAFEWCDRYMKAAARVHVGHCIRGAMSETDKSPAEKLNALRAYALDRAMNEARYPSQSTSTPSNLMARYKASEWARFYQDTADYHRD